MPTWVLDDELIKKYTLSHLVNVNIYNDNKTNKEHVNLEVQYIKEDLLITNSEYVIGVYLYQYGTMILQRVQWF